MSELKKVIAVANDFSSESKCAIAHAAIFAKKDGSELLLIHVLDGKSNEKLQEEGLTDARIKDVLAAECDRIEKEYGVSSRYATPEGSIFKDIGETVKNEKAKLLIMGTHGIQSLGERLLGSWALRIVDSSPVPTLIVQNKMPLGDSYKRVVMEVDATPECKILLKSAIMMHKTYGSEVILFASSEDDTFGENQIALNMQFCIATLTQAGVTYSTAEQKPGNNYYRDLVRYGSETYADLILIIANNNKDFADYLTEPEQKVIYNSAQIPVLCVTPVHNYIEDNFSFSGLNF